MQFWDLPGPQGFCDRVEDFLRDKKNLIIALPDPSPAGFIEALCSRLNYSGWNRLNIQAIPGASPENCLFEQLVLETESSQKRTPSLLLDKLDPGQIVIVDNICSDEWPSWKEFLTQFELVSRGVSSFNRPLLIAVAKGIPESLLPKGAIALGVATWQGVVSEMDMFSYAGTKVREKGLEGNHAQLIAMTIARLAQWDVAAADILLEASHHEVFSPSVILKKLALLYGWTTQHPQNWENGVVNTFNGSRQIHSAFLALEDHAGEVNMRVWSSQASILLPLIELHRRAIVKKIRHRFKFPVTVNEEQITDAYDLEIGPLAYLATEVGIDQGIRAKLIKLRNVRNALAHLDVLDANTALDPSLLILNS